MNNIGKPALHGLTEPTVGTFFVENHLSSDVYALGMTAIQALTGKFPHELPVDNYDEVIWRNLVNVSNNLAGILTQMVRFRSGDRYQNAGQVLQALNQAFAPNPVSPPRHIPTTIPSPPPQIPIAIPAPTPHNIRLQTPRADYTKFDQLLAANNQSISHLKR
jgi:serine/threonine protein kinase